MKSDRGRSRAYDDAFLAVRVVVNQLDPIGLIAAGAPEDEYDAEVQDLVRLIMREEAFDEETIAAIWRHWFGDDYPLRASDQLAAQTRELRRLQSHFALR